MQRRNEFPFDRTNDEPSQQLGPERDLEQRVSELEREMRELKAREFHYYPPLYQPLYVPPAQANPLPRFTYIGDPLPGSPGYLPTTGGLY